MPAWKAMQQSLREWMYRAERAEAERNEWKRRAEAAEAALTLLDGYAAARLADPYNDKLTFAVWLQSRK